MEIEDLPETAALGETVVFEDGRVFRWMRWAWGDGPWAYTVWFNTGAHAVIGDTIYDPHNPFFAGEIVDSGKRKKDQPVWVCVKGYRAPPREAPIDVDIADAGLPRWERR